MNQKIVPLSTLDSLTNERRERGKVIVQCHGVFDLLHIGHIRHFEAAKRLGDVLVVTVTPDRYVNKGPGRPVFAAEHRASAIAALECVDYVAITDHPTAVEAIGLLRPAIYVKGADYRNAAGDRTGGITREQNAVEEAGGRIAFTDEIVFSSSALLNRHFDSFSEPARQFLEVFSTKYTVSRVVNYLASVRHFQVLVVGEAIIDEYQYCKTLGKAGKEPILAARQLSTERFAGGALAVANQIAAVADPVSVFTCLGRLDSYEDFIREKLHPGVKAIFHYTENASTILKRRFVELHPMQKLFEVYVMDEAALPVIQEAAIRADLARILPQFDVVVAADYGHGRMTPHLVETLCDGARFLAVNTQVNAGNQGFHTISRYRRADFISISERELRMDARQPHADLRQLTAQIAQKLSCRSVVITRGDQGCLCWSESEGFCEVPAFTECVTDRVGAGDAVLSVAVLLAAAEAPIDVIGFIASCVGAMAVGVVGNRESIPLAALVRFVERLMKQVL